MRNKAMNLIPVKGTEKHLQDLSKIDIIAAVPESSVWLANHRSPQTRRKYKESVSNFIQAWEIKSEEDWKKIKPAHAIAWREKMIEEGLGSRTINSRLSAVSSLFKHLVEKQVVNENPVRDIKRPNVKANRTRTPSITAKQARRMLDSPPSDTLQGLRDRAILETLFRTGCRIGEIPTLKVKDFYEDAGYTVLHFKVKGGKELTKAIHQELPIAIRRYLTKAGHTDNPDSPLFLAVKKGRRKNDQQPLTIMQLSRIFHKYAQQAGLTDRIRPHTSRATFATIGLESGVSLEEMQAYLGHEQPQTTKMYDHRKFGHQENPSFRVNY